MSLLGHRCCKFPFRVITRQGALRGTPVILIPDPEYSFLPHCEAVTLAPHADPGQQPLLVIDLSLTADRMAQRAKNVQAAAVPLGFRGIFTVFPGGHVLPQEPAFLVQNCLALRRPEAQIPEVDPWQ